MTQLKSIYSKALRLGIKTAGFLLLLSVLQIALLRFPDALFGWSVSYANLALHSDQSFESDAGREILELVESRLISSSLYDAEQEHAIFISNAEWRQRLLFSHVYGVGGVNYYPASSNVFLAGALIEENRLISPSGRIVEEPRSLDYFAAHEITHTLLKQAAGIIAHATLPEYVREGLPDYIAMGGKYSYEKMLEDFLSESRKMDRQRTGLYYRYHFLVAHLLEKELWSERELLSNPPDQSGLEERIRSSQ